MKATGMIRRIDELGRIVIPKEIRRTHNLNVGDELEIFIEADGYLIMRKHSRIFVFNDIVEGVAESIYRSVGGTILIADRERILASSGAYRKLYEGMPLTEEVDNVVSRRRGSVLRGDSQVNIVDGDSSEAEVMYIAPIMAGGDIYGSIIALIASDNVDIATSVIDAAASFIALNIGK